MKTWFFFLLVVSVWMVSGGVPQTVPQTIPQRVRGQEKGKMDEKISLPSEVEGWKWDGVETKYNSRSLFDYIDGAAELYLAYGFQNLTVRRLEKANQPPMTAELYEMASSEDAYGVFSFDRHDEPAGIGQGSEFGGGLLRFWKGKFFVSVYSDGGGPEVEAAVLKLGSAVSNLISETGPEPKLLEFIPGLNFGLLDQSVCFLRSHVLLNQRFFIAHQNILNLNRRTEAVFARYLRDKVKTPLLLIRYPGVKEAGEAYQTFLKAYLPEALGKDRSRTEDRKWTIARQKNEFILIVFGAATEADGESLLKATEARLSGGR